MIMIFVPQKRGFEYLIDEIKQKFRVYIKKYLVILDFGPPVF